MEGGNFEQIMLYVIFEVFGVEEFENEVIFDYVQPKLTEGDSTHSYEIT